MELHGVTLLHLYYFQRAARLGSVSRAASDLHVAQPALSKHIARLEAALGVPLFRRSRKGVQLTEAGRLVLEHVERMLEEWWKAQEQVGRLERPLGARLHVGVTPSFAHSVLPRVAVEFLREHPEVELRVEVGHSEEIVQQVLGQELDGGLITGPVGDPRLEQEVLGAEEFVLAVPAGHPWAQREEVPLAALDGASLVVPTLGRWHRLYIAPLCRARGVRLRIRVQVQDYAVLEELVRSGFGVGLVPCLALAEDRPGIRRVRLVDPTPVRELSWVQRRGRPASRAVVAFVRCLRLSLTAHPYSFGAVSQTPTWVTGTG